MGRTRLGARAAVAVGVLTLLAAPGRSGAQMQALDTTIDWNYTYEQEHLGSEVNAATGFQQKYQVKLSTTLSSSYDFLGAISVDLDNQWDTDAASTEKVAPTLELGVKGPQSGMKFSYSGAVDTTDEYRETAESKKYSNTADLDIEVTPSAWPEFKFKLQEKRDYERGVTDTSGRTMEVQLRDEFFDVQTEFSLKLDKTIDEVPESGVSDTLDWSWKATYKEVILRDVDFEVAYEIKESYSEDTIRGVFTGSDEDYTQSLKTRLKKSLELSPRMSVGATWEYQYNQDLLELDYDYKVQNKYAFDLRFDVLPMLKITGEARRETEREVANDSGEDTSKLTDTVKGAFDYDLVDWLRFGGKAEWRWESSVDENTGASVDHADDQQYELTAKNKFGDYWDLTAGASWSKSYTEEVLTDEEAKFKADLKLKLLDLDQLDMVVSPTYESSRSSSWDEAGRPTDETYTSDAKIKFEAKAQLLDLLKVTFSHEYGQKITKELDEVLNYRRELGFNEDTRLNVAIDGLLEDLKLEGEIERKADDTEDSDGDSEAQVVEVSYALKLDWRYEQLSLSSAFKYTDKGEDDDDLEFTAKVGWKGDRIDISGDYQFTKTYATLTDEDRKLNLKLSYKF